MDEIAADIDRGPIGDERANDMFVSLWPSPTAGDGRIKANNLRTGYQQGMASSKRKISCKQCGYIYDIAKFDHSGGSQEGDGAGGAITKLNTGGVNAWGDTWNDDGPDQAFRAGSGCPLCFSRNGSADTLTKTLGQEPRFVVGF